MTNIKVIAKEIKAKIEKASAGDTIRPSVLFCGCNSQLKKDMHKLAKRMGLTPFYSIEHPAIKVELKNNKIIETDKHKTIIMNYEHFEYICRCLET